MSNIFSDLIDLFKMLDLTCDISEKEVKSVSDLLSKMNPNELDGFLDKYGKTIRKVFGEYVKDMLLLISKHSKSSKIPQI